MKTSTAKASGYFWFTMLIIVMVKMQNLPHTPGRDKLAKEGILDMDPFWNEEKVRHKFTVIGEDGREEYLSIYNFYENPFGDIAIPVCLGLTLFYALYVL